MNEGSSKLPGVRVYTDGACVGNPGPGGWAAILAFEGDTKELTGSVPRTTNNRMELGAAIEALQSLEVPHRVQLYTDSEYLRRGITEWLPAWVRAGWRRARGNSVKNRDLWEELHRLARAHEIEWHWVRGHSGHRLNERVDRLARGAIRRPRVERSPDEVTHLYVKASCTGPRGSGGWGIVCTRDDKPVERSGGEPDTTANRMAIRAALEGLRACPADSAVYVHTTSRYLFDGATNWLRAWIHRGWRTSDGRAVRNQDLWNDLVSATKGREVEWRLASGAASPPESERAATLARQAARRGKVRGGKGKPTRRK